jgi:hypothetical protein
MYLLYIFPLSSTHTYGFVVLTSLTHPRKILLVALQIGKWETGKAKDLSAPLRTMGQVVADVPSGLSLTPPQETKNKNNK